MPGATTARLVSCCPAMAVKLFMMPQTVPNRPTKGAVDPTVARKRSRGCSLLNSKRAARRMAFSMRRFELRPAFARRCARLTLSGSKDRAGQFRAAPCDVAGAGHEAFEPPHLSAEARQPDRLFEDDRPADDRGEGEDEHHAFHHRVRIHDEAVNRHIEAGAGGQRRQGCLHKLGSCLVLKVDGIN